MARKKSERNRFPGVQNVDSDALKRVLHGLGITVQELAFGCGVGVSTAQKWLQGITRPRFQAAKAMAFFLSKEGTSPADLLTIGLSWDASPDTSSSLPQTAPDKNALPAPSMVPYRGLLPFDEEHAEFFYGRERFIIAVRTKLDSRAFVAITGLSGSGKSSLAVAGVITRMRKAGWTVVRCRPGNSPIESLATAVLQLLRPDLDAIGIAASIDKTASLIRDGKLFALLGQIQARAGVLVYIDQFEELYTDCPRGEAETLIQVLSHTLSAPSSHRLKFLISLRADFFAHTLSSPVLTDLLQDGDIRLGMMTRDELRQAIERPAVQVGFRFEHGLIDRLLDDAGNEPGSLPLVQFSLQLLCEQSSDGTLTHTAYSAEVGRIGGVISNRAETTYRSLSSDGQRVVKRIMTNLVFLPESGGQAARRRITVTQLEASSLSDLQLLHRTLECLIAARLVVAGDSQDGPTVEVAHEAVVRHWPRLQIWLHDDGAFIRWRQLIHILLVAWRDSGRSPPLLLRGTLLDEGRVWLAQRRDDLGELELRFLHESIRSAQFPLHSENSIELRFRGKLSLLAEAARNCGLEFVATTDQAFDEGDWSVRIAVTPVNPTYFVFDHSSVRTVVTSSEAAKSSAVALEIDDSHLLRMRQLQLKGATGSLLELIQPSVDQINEPRLRLTLAAMQFDMMHARGKYRDAAGMIKQELALHEEADHFTDSQLLALRIRYIHHRMFFEPVAPLWQEMRELLSRVDASAEPGLYGEILCMLGGNLGALRGDDNATAAYLSEAIAIGRRTDDDYLVCRALRKQADFLRCRADFEHARRVWTEAWDLSEKRSGTRQGIYLLVSRADLERQVMNFRAAEDFARAGIEAAEVAYIPGWVANGYLTLANISYDKSPSRVSTEVGDQLDQAELRYRNSDNAWGVLQAGILRTRVTKALNVSAWRQAAQKALTTALQFGYSREAEYIKQLLSTSVDHPNCLLFL